MPAGASEDLAMFAFGDCHPDAIHRALCLTEAIEPVRTHAWLVQLLFGDTSYLARCDDKIVGVALACIERRRTASFYVEKVAVESDWRGRGIARALLLRVARQGRALGCSDMWLTTDPANAACDAWLRLGFRPESQPVETWPPSCPASLPKTIVFLHLVSVPGGHFMHREHPSEVNRELLRVLDDVKTGPTKVAYCQ